MQEKPSAKSTQTAAPDDPLIGFVIGSKYEILSRIGEGGSSLVYLAKHLQLNSKVAVKILATGPTPTQKDMQRFEREAQAMSALNHPNIAYIYDYGLIPRPFIVMEYLEGKSLADILKNDGAMPWKEGLPILIQVCDGLDAAHKQNLIHRDIKPGNLVVCLGADGQLNAKILDFGIAKALYPDGEETLKLTATRQTLGSPPYMSPEQCTKNPMDARSDIYSLGCSMFELFTGKLAFDGRSQMEVMQKHLLGDTPDMVAANRAMKIPEALEAVVLHCLAREPADRYQSAADLKADLQLIEEGKARDIRWQPQQGKRLAKKRLTRASIIAALIAVALLCFAARAQILDVFAQWFYDFGVSQFAQLRVKDSVQPLWIACMLQNMRGENDGHSLQSKIKLAEAYYFDNKESEAADLSKEVKAIKSGNASAPLRRSIEKAQALMGEKNYAQAEPLFKQALAENERTNGEHNLTSAECYAGLAGVHLALNQLPQSEEMASKALAVRRDLLDPDDMHLAYSYNDLGAVLNAEGKYAEARPPLETALAITKRHQSERDSLHLDEGDQRQPQIDDELMVAAEHINLASAAKDSGDRFRAEHAIEADINTLLQSSPHDENELTPRYVALAKLLMDTDRLEASDRMFRQAQSIEEKQPQKDAIAFIYFNRAALCTKKGRKAESAALLKQSQHFAQSDVDARKAGLIVHIFLTPIGQSDIKGR